MTKTIIRYNKILDEITKVYSLTLSKYKERARRETDQFIVSKKLREYRQAWEPISQKVFRAIESIVKRPFPYSIVNVNIVWVINRTEAFGMVIPVSLSVDEFIITFTHELMHLSGGNFTDDFMEKYKEENVETRVHIAIHAMLEYVWREIIDKPEYVGINKARCKKHCTNDYSNAWNIVEKDGYKNILKMIK